MSGLPDRPPGKIVRREQVEAWNDGFAFLKAARERANGLEAEVEHDREQARTRGYDEGLASGRRKAAREFGQLRRQADHYFDTLSEPLAKLSLDIVQRLLRTFDDHELIQRFVAEAIAELRDATRIVIRVAPCHRIELEDWVRSLPETESRRISHVEPDHALGVRQCLLVSPVAVIDIGIDSQFDRLSSALLNMDHGDTTDTE